MGKGIKMRSAKDHRGHTYTVETLQRLKDAEGAAPPLLCDDPSCACSVRFVPRHQQNRSNRIESIDVPAYIGLSTGSEHAEGCRYDAAKRFTAIADQSDPEFLSALGDGKRELRLFALHNGLRKPGLSGDASVAAGNRPAAKAGSSSTDFAASERKLDSYLRTASDLVVLRAMCESDALLAAELTLRMGAKRIPWKQFFFEADRLDEAWEFIRRGGEAAHPIALAAAVRHHHSPGPGATYKSSFMNCFSLTRKTADPRRLETSRSVSPTRMQPGCRHSPWAAKSRCSASGRRPMPWKESSRQARQEPKHYLRDAQVDPSPTVQETAGLRALTLHATAHCTSIGRRARPAR